MCKKLYHSLKKPQNKIFSKANICSSKKVKGGRKYWKNSGLALIFSRKYEKRYFITISLLNVDSVKMEKNLQISISFFLLFI